MYTDPERGVWFPPRPLDGGTPISRGPWDGMFIDAASSAWMIDSTSSMQMRTFSGLRSVGTSLGA